MTNNQNSSGTTGKVPMSLNKLRNNAQPLLLYSLAIALVWQGAFFLIRLWAVWEKGDLYLTTGGEENPTYGIWRLINGYSLYTPPDEAPYVLNIYNFLFYYFNSWIASLFSLNGEALLLSGRIVSVCFTIAGFFMSLGVLQLLCPLKKSGKFFWTGAALLALAWFEYDNLGWLVVSVRPDSMALGWAMAGLFFYLKWDQGKKVIWLLLSILMFSCAWAVKQSVVGIMGGCFLHGLLFGKNRPLLVLFPLGPLVMAALGYGLEGQNWILNCFKAPGLTMSQTLGTPVVPLIRSALNNNFLLVGFAATLFIIRSGWKNREFQKERLTLIVAFSGICSLIMSVLALSRNGSTTNHLCELYFMAALLTARVVVLCFDKKSVEYYGWVGALIALGLFVAQPLSIKNYFKGKTGRILADTPDQVVLRRDFVEWYRHLPEPRLTVCSHLSLPWISGNNGGECYIMDPTYHPNRLRENALKDHGYAGILTERKVNTLLLSKQDPLVEQALAMGYRSITIPPKYQILDANWAGIDSTGTYFGPNLDKMVVLVRQNF